MEKLFFSLTNSGQSPGNYNTDSFCALLVTTDWLGTSRSKLRSEPMLGRLVRGAPRTAGDTLSGQQKPALARSFLGECAFILALSPDSQEILVPVSPRNAVVPE